ncbi:(2Fe-2S)-binding protein [Catenulispora subtropica]|uniref:(2Fe-2S)-binding protein n=1 Tax=Catenulispora subtropica TaxID=450798 RepID=A0ABN2TD29_9ACTN
MTNEIPAPASVSDKLAALGPYFAVEFHGASQEPEAPWRPMTELVDEPAVMQERVAGVRAFLAAGTGREAAAVELRVAASVVHLGLVARVTSPLLALAVEYGWRGSVRAADLWWQPGLASTFPLSISETVLGAGEAGTGGFLSELEAVIAEFGVNRHILRGNVGSALAGASRMLAGDAESRVLAEMIGSPELVGCGELHDGVFRRRSCCLIYRAAPARDGSLCGDCVLAHVGRVRAA